MRALCVVFLTLVFTLPVRAQAQGTGLTPLPERPPAPEFDLVDIDGNSHRLSSYRGKVLIVNFWATWCPPCREEMPSMQRAWETLQKVGEDEDRIFQFTANYPVEFPLLMDRKSAVVGAWPVRGLPTTFVVDPQGRLAYRAIGGREWDDEALLDLVRALKE